jgi:hypothetical protein
VAAQLFRTVEDAKDALRHLAMKGLGTLREGKEGGLRRKDEVVFEMANGYEEMDDALKELKEGTSDAKR